MSVIITPADQLEFHSPFTQISKESLIVKNPGNEPVAFKVKTTAPKQYCVRPNAGRIEPNSEIEVQIILQPFKEELPVGFKCKDKFLVQTAVIKDTFENLDISSMWSQIETTEKSSMHQHKIKCSYVHSTAEEVLAEEDKIAETVPIAEPIIGASSIPAPTQQEEQVKPPIITIATTTTPPNESITNTLTENTITSPPREKSLTNSPHVIPTSVTTSTSSSTTTTTTPVAKTTSPPVVKTSPPVVKTSPTPVVKTSPAPAVNPRETDSTDNTSKEIELKAALEKISLLEKQLSDIRKEEGLRARNQTGTSNRKLSPTVQPLDAVHQHLAALEKPRPTEGYPPQVVFGVAFLVFIITYLFF